MNISTKIKTDPFSAYELAGWEKKKLVNSYNDYFGRLTQQVVESLLKAANVQEDMLVLDIATGPGYAAGMAKQIGAEVTGIDFSSSMVEIAKKNFPEVNFLQADAENLPFKDNSFDAVVMNFGLLHFAHPEQALKEIYRVLHPGKRMGFTVWSLPDDAVGFKLVMDAVYRYGTMDVPIPPAPPFFRFSAEDESKRIMHEIGFIETDVQRIMQVWRFKSPDEIAFAFEESGVRIGGLLKAQTPEAIKKIRIEIANQAEKYRKGDHIELEMPAVLSSGQKPQ